MAIQSQAKLPVIDFSNENLRPGSSSWLSVREQVCRALEEYGCFVAELGNRVPLELHNTTFDVVIPELFDLPPETKKKVAYDKPFHGYVSSPLHERMVIDNATAPEAIQKLKNILWPNGNDHFSESADSYAGLMMELDKTVTRMVFENYGVEKLYDSHMELTTRTLAFLKYKEPQKTGTNAGLKNHTDKHFTSILHQNRIRGLEIKTKDGEWIVYDPSPTSFIFLAADALQAWSNDRIQACVHRVMLSEEQTIRYSLGLFAFNDGIIQVPEELVDGEHPLLYKPFNILEYVKAQVGYGKELSVKIYCGVETPAVHS